MASISRPELLSPAGNWDCLVAAVKNGADAVYLGTRDFNARIYARNFSLQELDRAVNHCHRQGVRVYLTLNTLVKNHEVRQFFNVLSDAYALGIDGVIIQHISFLEIIKRNFPGMPVFLSTQAAIGNTSSASLLKSADRFILPRELPLAEVKKFVEAGYRVEVFVHGALCYSYSGLCLFSSFVGSRSGNRGSCAQLCRQKYNGTYPLSTKELCLADRIPDLIRAGISGFKIEGRMRSALYVAVATRLYRKAIDAFLAGELSVPQREMSEIEVVFNREFTRGLIFGDTDLVSPEKPMNRGAFLGAIKNSELTLSRPLSVGDGVGVWSENAVTGAVIKELYVGGRRVTSAKARQKVRLGIEAAEGARIYLTSSGSINIEPGFEVKRTPIPAPKRRPVSTVLPEITPTRASLPVGLLVRVYSLKEAIQTAHAGADAVFYDIFAPDFPSRRDWQEKAALGAYLPRVMNDEELASAIDLLGRKKPKAVLTGNLGFLSHAADFAVPVYLDYSLNAFNDLDRLFFQKFRAVPVASPELSFKELTALQNKDVVIFCHGDIVLMNTKIDPGIEELIDEKGAHFRVRKESTSWQILNSRPFGMFSDIRRLVDAGFTQFFIDRQGKAADTVTLYRRILREDVSDRRMRKHHTSGHLYRPVM